MPRYVVESETPIHVMDLSDVGVGGGPIMPERPSFPERPGHPIVPSLPPRDEWPELPPWLKPGVGLPIPPTPEFPMVPVDPEVDPPVIWPPGPMPPTMPDFSNKTLALARIFVSRHVNFLAWVVIDHDDAKAKWEMIKDKLPAGGVGGTPPARPTPGS
jgi:hypothetical protein